MKTFRTKINSKKVYQKNHTRKFRIGLLAALMLCVFGAKAQTDYSGIYFLANYGNNGDIYNETGIGNNYYLRPAADPVQPNNIDAYWFPIDHPELNDPEKPFLTTNKTGHDMSIAAWAIQKTGDDYYFIHVGTGKYVRYEPCYSGEPSGNARRKAMHLEACNTPPADNSYKFVVEVVDNDNAVYAICPQTLALTTGNRYWNVSGGNTDVNNGQGSSLYFNGLIGIYSEKGYSTSGRFSNWKFEPQIPVLSADEANQQVIVSGLWTNADIRYTLDGTEPTNTSAQCTGGIIPIGDARKTVMVRAYYNGFSTLVSTINVDFRVWNEITDLSQINSPDKRYRLIDDIDDASSHVTIDGFTGEFDGNFKTITGLKQPLFSTLDGGYTSGQEITVCNVILKDVDIVGHEGNTGAIACTAKGNVRIYNCGIIGDSKVGGTGDTGGLVGLLQHYSYSPQEPKYSFARVVNCYSFADIVAAGTYAAGIVGNNNCGSNAQNYGALNFNLRTAVVNCVFYGDIKGGTNRYPVYGNKELHNNTNGINNYNYYREEAKFDDDDSYDKHNISWPVREEFLTRFEYYRNILNCNRNLCAFYVSGAPYSDPANVDAHGKIAKWVLDPEIAPYPILKKWDKYPSIINPDPDRVWDTLTKQWKNRETEALPYLGKKMGTLSVTVKAGKHPRLSTYGLNADQYSDRSLPLNILDMDTLNHDYGYYKVQLPYFNEEFGNPESDNHYEKYCANYTDSIVTGWKITLVDGGDGGDYTFNDDWESGCNFANRSDKFKDLYAKSGRVFAQGGFYYVPEGVTSITIEAYWGKAVYVHNAEHSVDRVDLGGSPFAPAGTYNNKFNGQDVYTSIKNAIAQLSLEGSGATALTVYDQAIVLVGNVQHKNGAAQKNLGWGGDTSTSGSEEFATNNRPFTITSVDLDFDNEPDYCLQLQWGRGTTRVNIHPVRFDFLPVPSLGMAIRKKDDFLYAIGIFSPRGHFEVTETAFMHTGQFEYETRTDFRKEEAPLILNGGEYEQFVSSRTWNKDNGRLDRTKYIILGGHVWMKEFTPGKHTDCNAATRHCAVSVMGGEYANRFCLSGVFVKNEHVLNVADNPRCYTNGGKFGTMSGAGLENIAGNVTFEIDHSLIKEFYGGGLNAARPISGNINVTINNSIVGKYCGGPFTGDMAVNTKVTTNATNTIFGYFYGGGNGGTNFNRNNLCDWTVPADAITEENWRSTDPIAPNSSRKKGSFDGFRPLVYVSDDVGYQAQFEFELIDMSSGYPPDTPLEETENCAVMRTYRHEAQFTATEVQEVESTLTNCTVLHDFYGGGNLGTVKGNVTSTLDGTTVWGSAYGGGNDSDAPSFSVHNPPTVSTELVFPHRDKASVNHPGSVGFQKDGDVIRKYKWINIDDPLAMGHTTNNNPAFQGSDGEWYCVTKKDMSDLGAVHGDTYLNINGSTKIYGQREVEGAVYYDGAAFGGGNKSTVFGDSNVTINGTEGLLVNNVYGGGNIAITEGNSTVEIYNGTIGIMDEYGMPYTNNDGKFISGRVFAAGKGAVDPAQPENGKHLGLVMGNSTLNMYGGHVLSCLYGGGEISNVGLTTQKPVDGTPYSVAVPINNTGIATVTMTGGEVGIERSLIQILQSHEIGNVYGSGQGDPNTNFNTWTNVNNASVHISGGRVWGSVFGGGEEGHVLGNAITTISGTNTIIGTSGETSYDGNVFGGGRGHQAIALTAGTIGGNATVRVLGGHIFGSVFGGGRNGSVGTYLVPEGYTGLYGEMQAGNPNEHGLINVYIGGEGQDGNIFIGHQSTSDHDRVGGNVYGGGKGVVENPLINPIAFEFARVRETHVYVAQAVGKQTFIEGSVFGSGEDGHIMGDTYVTVSGGQIGGKHWVGSDATPELCDDVFHGNVYGGGRGLDQWEDANHNLHYSATAGLVYGNTNVTITGGRVCRNVFGGGNLASVGIPKDENSGTASILITGDAIIGVEPNSTNRNGIVFGAGKGRAGHDFKDLSFVKNTNITITGNAKVLATVYGSGEDGHVREKTNILIGDATVNGNPVDGSNVVIGVNGVSGKEGNVYGAGRGIDLDEEGHYSPTAGEVGVSTKIEINNGWVKGSVYGGGRTASVGTEEALEAEDNTPADFPDFGHTTIIIGGNARIGTEDGDNGYVFGAGKGDAGSVFADLTNVFETNVTIKDNAQVRGSVFGGGEDGHVKSYSWTDPTNPEHSISKHGDTHVFIEGSCKIGSDGAFGRRGNVYGGGRGIDQYVGNDGLPHFSPTAGLVVGNTHVTIAGGNVYQNVYGGGNKSIVQGRKTVNIKNGEVHRNVYGGSNEIPFNPSWIHSGLKTVNMSGGKAHKLFGCSHNTIDGDFRMFDGENEVISSIDAQGNHKLVYLNGGANYTGDVNDLTLEARNTNPTSFVNISGGYLYNRLDDDQNAERGSIHGAGLAGLVYGSVIINIGADAIRNSPFREYNVDSADLVRELTLHGSVQQYAHQPTKLQVSGSVFGGADYYQSENNPGDWNLFNVKGYSNIYIDGNGYNMEDVNSGTSFAALPAKCMVIDGNLYGSGTHCESGEKGRNIIVRNYGNRVNRGDIPQYTIPDPDTYDEAHWFHHSTRPMGTIQRVDNLVIDNSNFSFTGMPRLGHDDGNLYSVMNVDSCFYISNGSAITLGGGDVPAHMDSIRRLQSAYLIGQSATYNVFSKKFASKLNWGWIGLVNPASGNAYHMCFMDGTDAGATLDNSQENIIIFNSQSKLWVRYHEWEKETPSSNTYVDRQYYGELQGFFRMLSPYHPRGIESFAFARPKILDNNLLSTGDHYNMADGGFLSYNIEYNDFFADRPNSNSYENFTNTLQYPYTNVLGVQLQYREAHPALDVQDYRMWVITGPFDGRCWYVDGRGIGSGGWGKDLVSDGWGLFPDKPKLTVNGVGGVYDGTFPKNDQGGNSATKINFDYDGSIKVGEEETDDPDIIFVVGPIMDVNRIIDDVTYGSNLKPDHELRLYRYPGGHKMSNDQFDLGSGPAPTSTSYNGLSDGITAGPGPNYIAMLDVGSGRALDLNNVYMDGLYGYSIIESDYLMFKDHNYFNQAAVTKPMIETHNTATLTLKGALTLNTEGLNKTVGTILTRGYNNTDASGTVLTEPVVYNYYINSNGNYGDAINGGGLYVEHTATVNVEGLVRIFENKQNNNGKPISSNVFLPTFDQHLYITDALSNAARIGITSPVKNTAQSYKANTFSPLAVANKSDATNSTIAENAWEHNNFHDDLQWFFGRGFNLENGSHTTYYKSTIPDYQGNFTTNKTLFFGWTWNNVVRREPTDFDITNINSPQDLAWLISLVNGLNGQTKNALSGQTITQTTDLDMQQYIWLPIGSEKESSSNFAGTFEGCGHLIKNLTSRYIGIGDYRYEYNNYGMFGKTNGATINRTFLVNEHIEPNNMGNLGGLIGMMEGENSLISNSEAAGIITSDIGQQMSTNACGGLVGFFIDGEIRNSMAMHTTTASRGYVGGLVGTASDPESGQHNVKLRNSFANTHFNFYPNVVGAGLMGNNIFASIKNCYSAISKTNLDNEHEAIVATLVHTNTGSVSQCYGNEGFSLNVNNFGGADHISECATYTPVISSDKLGYVYSDNMVTVGATTLPLFKKLNEWTDANNGSGHTYAHWARPTLSKINADLPVPLLCEFDGSVNYQGEFRSVGTYAGGPALQYGGSVRDDNELDGALADTRLSANDALFVYGDVTTAPTVTPTANANISIHEDAAILAPGTLSSFENTYVGISFDNTSRNAMDYYGTRLLRDWHMLSSPLADAPLGINYTVAGNDQNVNDEDYQHGFQSESLPVYAFSGDGYFPNAVPSDYVKPTGEKYLYPYDYFCWYEPDWQWINFKRNGPSHWHYDTPSGSTTHEHIEYHYDNNVNNSGSENLNESELVPGKGYMMAIQEDTYMQSHGRLNGASVSVNATARANTYGEQYIGHNLVGNPFHGYLDFDRFVKSDGEYISPNNGKIIGNNYYVYDADLGGYYTYPTGGSSGGEYASRYLHPHQGFFIKIDKKNGDDQTIVFDAATMLTTRQGSGGSSYRNEQPAYPLVNLYAEDGDGRKEILVVEFERPENGGGSKAKALRNGKHQMYARFNGEDYGAFFAKKGTERVTVCFTTDADENTVYTLNWNLQNGDFHTMRLIDNMMGVDYDMLAHDSYTFEASKYDYSTRFYIVFSCTDVEEPEVEEETDKPFAFFDGSQWVINGNGQLELVDMTGRVLQSMRVAGDQSRVSFNRYASGVYLLRLYGNKSAKVQKIVITK